MNMQKLCAMCQKEWIPKGRAIYCGSYKTKTGCSYIKKIERNKIYVKLWIKNHPNYHKEAEGRRTRKGYYQLPEVIMRRKKLAAERFLRKKKLLDFNPSLKADK